MGRGRIPSVFQFANFILLLGMVLSTSATSVSGGVQNTWVWVSGSNTVNQFGVYGTQGVPGPNNIPGSRYSVVSWVDTDGDLWLSGGYGNDGSGGSGYLNDLWNYDGTSWTWISGANTINQSGFYGTKGVADLNSVPGGRYGGVSWKDAVGNLWLFGGYGYDSVGDDGWLNDLWKYDGVNWTWVSGSNTVDQAGWYGTKTVPGPNNVPGSRSESISWMEEGGGLWLFGGYGYDGGGSTGRLNDLWRFDGIQWVWMSGSDIANQSGVYGTQGVADSNNVPGARDGAVCWIDEHRVLWLFGGYGYDSDGTCSRLNDLWRFDDPNWTWVSGSKWADQVGAYGTRGVADANNVPGARDDSTAWIDTNNNLWLLGGQGYDGAAFGELNDLWQFDGTDWTWVTGSNTVNQSGVYGTEGILDPNNIPGARDDSVSWIGSGRNVWLFGGYGYDSQGSANRLNDLWEYYPPCASFLVGDFNSDCTVNFADFAVLGLSWYANSGDPNWNYVCDISELSDGRIDELDLKVFADHWLDMPSQN